MINLRHHPIDIAQAAEKLSPQKMDARESAPDRLPVAFCGRPNISLRVDTFARKDEKRDAVLRRVEYADKPGIVYVSTHRNAETIARDLQLCGIEAVFYHGGLKPRLREEIEARFINGDIPVMVATNSFGIGIDKPDIRFVYHADVSESLEGYGQEIGLAGRDGQDAEAVLFYRFQDINAQQYKTGGGNVDARALETVAHALAGRRRAADREDLARETSISPRKLTSIVHKLEEVGAAKKLDSGRIKASSGQSVSDIAEAAAVQQQQLRDMRKRRLEMMQAYAECRTCRRAFLHRYFGAGDAIPCGNCDRCELAGIRPGKVA